MSSWLTLAITVILVAIAFLVLNRSIRTRTSQQAALDEIKREVGAIITELNQTTERNVKIVEDRIAQLEQLIRQADGRLKALRRDLPSTIGHELYDNRGLKARPDRVQTEREQKASVEDSDPPPAQKPGSGVEGSTAIGFPEPEVPMRQRVRQLYLQGLPLERIATIVGKSVGEIELIISLEEGGT